MFRFDNLLERWAEIYTPEDKRKDDSAKVHPAFFRISMIDANSYFVRNFNTVVDVCITYATHVDAEMNKQNPKQINYRHVIYILVKQPAGTLSKTQITDELGATEARYSTDDITQDLLAVLSTMKGLVGGKSLPADVVSRLPAEVTAFIRDTATDPDYREGLRGLQLEEAHWGTLPPVLNGWQICGLTIEQIVPRLLCVSAERYVQTEETE